MQFCGSLENQTAQLKNDESASGKSMSPPQFKLSADGKGGENTAQMKPNAKLNPDVQAKMENSMQTDFSDVNIVENSSKATQMNAEAFAQGREVHFAPGKFDQSSQKGQELIGHEFGHLKQNEKSPVQANTKMNGVPVNNDPALENEADQMGKKAAAGEVASNEATSGGGSAGVMQGYFVQNQESDMPIRVSEDLSVAVPQDGERHGLFAKKGKAKAANAQLASVGAKIELYEGPGKLDVEKEGSKAELVQVLPRNKMNGTEGENMEMYADCGRANSMITGSLSREAQYTDLQGNDKTAHGNGDPYYMKAAIFADVFKTLETDPKYADDRKVQSLVRRVNGWKERLEDYRKEYHAETDERKKERIGKSYSRYSKRITDAYYKLPEEMQRDFDERLGINDFAAPEVGEGFTMSTGGRSLDMDGTWNFHWAGVVMKSDSGKDTISLENFSVSDWEAQNTDWEYQMYGPAEKEGQTFHDQHKATKQHGTDPTTLNIKRR
jgi:hypothetical protein